ncbi:MAG: TIGR04282 family arsenosugar biosynthesis glycosyltransferase [Polyangia bacterium]
MRDVCLVVFAKAPVPGAVKTRLIGAARPGLRADEAAALHAAFVRDVCGRGAAAGFGRRRLYVAGELAHPLLVEVAAAAGFELRPQAGADLGARMHAALAAELDSGAAAVLLVGTDSPTLPLGYLRQAAVWLGGEPPADAVLGPALDGGYYLIGVRRALPSLFAPGIAWGTEQVLPETLRRLCALGHQGLAVRLLPPFYDVDTPSDLARLVADLSMLRGDPSEKPMGADVPATRAVLRALGLLAAPPAAR